MSDAAIQVGIGDVLKAVKATLEPFAKRNKGTAEIARDPLHLFSLLAQNPGALKVCAIFPQELPRSDSESFVDREFWVVVSRGKGFTAKPDKDLVDDTAKGKALYDLLEEARDLVRGMSFAEDQTEVTPSYKRLGPLQVPEGIIVDAYQLEFTIGCVLPEPTEATNYLADGKGHLLRIGADGGHVLVK